MKRLGIFLTKDEQEELDALHAKARNTPVITFRSGTPDTASRARHGVLERCHAMALGHGLPEIQGFYGCDLKTGELLRHEDN